jgi:DNA polymerase III epsilon subunit-like protein
MATQGSPFLALRDRAVALVTSMHPIDEADLLRHVYGGQLPASLQAQLLAPLLEEPRLRRLDDGRWTVAEVPAQHQPLAGLAFTTLALTTTGPDPKRARIVRMAALHVQDGEVVERFSATVNPGVRVPGYVAQRAGIETAVLNEQPAIASVFDEFERFISGRPLCAQEARLVWAFVCAEARRLARTLPDAVLLDVNELAAVLLDVHGKPTAGLVARHLGIGFTRLEAADEEARVLSLIVPQLLRAAAERGLAEIGALGHEDPVASPLRHGKTARALPEEPGIYVMRDASQSALYVGKARRLNSRVAAYVHRPLGATRRLEGLADAVQAVDTETCQTDLEALVLEERAIRDLQPRFNTVRQQRAPRLWIRLPPQPVDGKRAPARLEVAAGPEIGDGEYVGPFRNEAAAQHARMLARQVFELDVLRTSDRLRYVNNLPRAWAFLCGSLDDALALARAHHARAVLRGDLQAARQWEHRLIEVRDYDLAALRLPADPRHTRFAVVRPGPKGIELVVLDRAVLVGFTVLDDNLASAAADVLCHPAPRTTSEDTHVVLHWLGAQRPPAHLLLLPDDPLAAGDLISDAAMALFEAAD